MRLHNHEGHEGGDTKNTKNSLDCPFVTFANAFVTFVIVFAPR